MTLYVTVTQIAKTIKKLLESTAMSRASSGAKADLITEFAIQFYPGSPTGQRAFIRQCAPDYDPIIQVPPLEKRKSVFRGRSAGETEGGGRRGESQFDTCGFCRGRRYITNPDDLKRVPCFCQGDKEQEGEQCCYLRPSPLYPHGDLRNPCTAEAAWGIHEKGEPYDIISYACDVHLPRLLGHEGEGQGSFEFEVWPLKVELPVLDPTDRDFEEAGDTSHWQRAPDDDEGGFYEPNADADYYEERDNEVNYYDPQDAPDSYTEWVERLKREAREKMEQDPHYIPKFDRTGPANDPPDYDKEFEDMLKRFEFEPDPNPDTYNEQAARYYDEEGTLIIPLGVSRDAEDLFGAADEEDEEDEPNRCAVCGTPGWPISTDLGYCPGCGNSVCGKCAVYQVEDEDSNVHEIENHLRYEEYHGTKDEPQFGAADEENEPGWEPDLPIAAEGMGFTPEYVIVHREGDKARGSYVGSDPLYEEETDDFCCEIHQALSLAFEALAMVRRSLAIADNELAKEHFNDLAKPHTPGMHKESLACDVCGGGGLTREDDFCYGCGHIVCVSCIVQSGTCGDHTIEDHFPERDLHFVAD